MRFQDCLKILPSLLCLAIIANADPENNSITQKQNNSPVVIPTKVKYDALYAEILKKLPEDNRAKVDSARAPLIKESPSKTKKKSSSEGIPKERHEKKLEALKDLPPEVKNRVDKAMADMENRKEERKLEFKDLQK